MTYCCELDEQLNVRTLIHIEDVWLRESVLEDMARGFVGYVAKPQLLCSQEVEASRPAGGV